MQCSWRTSPRCHVHQETPGVGGVRAGCMRGARLPLELELELEPAGA